MAVDEMSKKVILALSLSVVALLASANGMPADAADEAIINKLASAKILPKGTTSRVIRSGNVMIIELTHYPVVDERTQKVDALLIARTIIHAYPVDCIIARFLKDVTTGAYSDVMVGNREIVGADAGIMGSAEILNNIDVVNVTANDSVEARCSKYCIAARRRLDNQDLREAEQLYGLAAQQAVEAARQEPKYIEGMVKLARAYSERDDVELETRVYTSLMDTLPSTSTPESLAALREIYLHFAKNKDWNHAEIVAKKLVDLQKNAGTTETGHYANDLQLLGASHRWQGHVTEAKTEYEEALAIKKKQHGDHHPALADALEGLGDCYAAERNTVKANEFFTQSKLLYDHAVVAKDAKDRISYDTYRSIIVRLNHKMGKKTR